jgi:hypothetical protein
MCSRAFSRVIGDVVILSSISPLPTILNWHLILTHNRQNIKKQKNNLPFTNNCETWHVLRLFRAMHSIYHLISPSDIEDIPRWITFINSVLYCEFENWSVKRPRFSIKFVIIISARDCRFHSSSGELPRILIGYDGIHRFKPRSSYPSISISWLKNVPWIETTVDSETGESSWYLLDRWCLCWDLLSREIRLRFQDVTMTCCCQIKKAE